MLTDPPYGTTACAWDSVLPFDRMWAGIRHAAKPAAAVVLCASQPFTSALVMSNAREFRYCWYWLKRPVNFLNAKRQPLRNVEDVLVFSGRTYTPQGLTPLRRVNRRSCSTETVGAHGGENVSEFTNYPRQTLEYVGERGAHPTQKPVALMRYLVRTYTNPGDTVLDFTMGSGTTGVACEIEGRHFIGIERDPAYFAIAEKRIREALL